MSVSHLSRLERGLRRTRYSTLARLAEGLVAAEPALGSSAVLLGDLVTRAGITLAPESEHAERVVKRRLSRWRKKRRRREAKEVWAAELERRRADEDRSALFRGMVTSARRGDFEAVVRHLEDLTR
jgi:transcriptional regulator with XRE-family HTH domain